MVLTAFITGRSGVLAQKEIEMAAKTLPFLWSSTILAGNLPLLKSELPNGRGKASLVADNAAALHPFHALQQRLGGTIKIVRLLERVDPQNLESYLTELLLAWHQKDNGREVGISLYGQRLRARSLGAALKKRLKQAGLSLRLIFPLQGEALSSAQVEGNHLALFSAKGDLNRRGRELILIEEEGEWWVGFTLTAQAVAAYRRRDYAIPAADPLSGMLPPKLAQIMINLASKGEEVAVYDPFCGNGRIVTEARLMGYSAYGSDLDIRKVEAAKKNLDWYAKEYGQSLAGEIIWRQDATSFLAAPACSAHLPKEQPWVIASEPYLGQPLREPLSATAAEAWARELGKLYLDFLKVWSPLTNSHLTPSQAPRRMLLIFPRVKRRGGLSELSLYQYLVDRSKQFGYSSLQISDYGRPDALISREVVEVSLQT